MLELTTYISENFLYKKGLIYTAAKMATVKYQLK